jgi:hypothetical protein
MGATVERRVAHKVRSYKKARLNPASKARAEMRDV